MHPAKTYALFTGLQGLGMGLMATAYSPFLLSVGLSLSDIAAINIFYWLAVSLAELPTGMLADGRSRAWSIRIGVGIMAVTFFGYSTVSGFRGALFWEIIGGIGQAFMSGAQQAWVTDALRKRGEAAGIGRAFGTAAIWRSVAAIAGGAAGAPIAALNLRTGFVLFGLSLVAAFIVSLKMMNGEGEPEKRVSELAAFKMSLQAMRTRPGLVWACAAAVAFGLVLPFNHYWAPFFAARVGQAGLSFIWMPVYATLAGAGYIVRTRKWFQGGSACGVILAMLLAGAGLMTAAWPGGVIGPLSLVIVHEFGRGLFDPMLEIYTQRRIDSAYRATFGSFQSLIGRAGYAVVLIGLWALTDGRPNNSATIALAWTTGGTLLVAAAVILWLFRPKN